MKTKTHSKNGFHASFNFGNYGGSFPIDQEGYTYTTQAGWLGAKMDWGNGHNYASKRARCTELAAEARREIKLARAAMSDWRKRN